MAKVLSGHALAYVLDSTSIVATTYRKHISFLMEDLYLMHMPWVRLLLLLLYGGFTIAQ